jgi:hypothetical protein
MERRQARRFFGERFGRGRCAIARPAPSVRHFIPLHQRLAIAFRQSGEDSTGPEPSAYIPVGRPVPGQDVARRLAARAIWKGQEYTLNKYVQNLPMRVQSPHARTTRQRDGARAETAEKRLACFVHMHKRSQVSFHGEKTMHQTHRKVAEQHELAARAHRTAAEHNERGDSSAADWHSERALEYSDHAYKLAMEAHTKSGEIESL